MRRNKIKENFLIFDNFEMKTFISHFYHFKQGLNLHLLRQISLIVVKNERTLILKQKRNLNSTQHRFRSNHQHVILDKILQEQEYFHQMKNSKNSSALEIKIKKFIKLIELTNLIQIFSHNLHHNFFTFLLEINEEVKK
jgi:hypothetical protein